MALTTVEYIQFMFELGNSNVESIDQFMFRRFGFDYWEIPFYADLKVVLEATMERVKVIHPNGYAYYEWIDK